MRFTLDHGCMTEGHATMGLELAGVGLTVVDYVADTVVPDGIAAEIFGLAPGQPVTRTAFHDRIHPDDRAAVLADVDKLIDPHFEDAIEVTHRTFDANGNIRWVHATKKLYRDTADGRGRAVSGVAAVHDITARKQAEETSNFLIKELQHRTLNVITVILSVARMIYDAGPKETFWERFEPRIQNLADNSKLSGTIFAPDLRMTLHAVLSPFLGGQSGDVTIDGPDIVIDASQAQAFAMIFHELATNSVKYGALGDPTAGLSICWDYADANTLVWRWVETRNVPVSRPDRTGFGTQVLETFASISLNAQATQYFGDLTYAYELTMPFANRNAA